LRAAAYHPALDRILSNAVKHQEECNMPIRSSKTAKVGKAIGASKGDSVYKVIEVIGTSTVSWEQAAINAVKVASQSLRDLRIAEVVKQDMVVEKGKVTAFRTRVMLSFKYSG